MSRNPVNLIVRFLLEIAALAAMGFWGWAAHTGGLRYLWMIALPVLAAFLWGAFRVPNDGGPPLVRVPGVVRLLIEVVFFSFATWGLFNVRATLAGWIFGGITLIHYLVSYDRLAWLVRQ